MWWSEKKLSGLSVGYSCVTRLLVQLSSSKLKGATESLHISARHRGRNYEFVFTSLSNTAFQVFSGVARVYSTYDETRLYRDVNLGGANLTGGESETDRELDKLAFEQAHSRTGSVRNLCGGEDDVGSLFVSNFRVVWSSCSRPCFAISLPFHQVQNVKVHASEFGPTLMLESSKSSGAYTWNFKVEPEETMDFLFEQITSLWKAHNQEPFFGIDTQVQAQACAEALAAKPTAITSQSEDVRTMSAESCSNPEENYLAPSLNGPKNSSSRACLPRPSARSFTSPAPCSPRRSSAPSFLRLSAKSFASPASPLPLRPPSNSFSSPVTHISRMSADHSFRLTASAQSLTTTAPRSPRGLLADSLSRPSADTSTSKTQDTALSKGSESELVYWVNPLGLLGLTPEQLEELNVE
ncbi:hypothetical protein DUNSADRAFT_15656 [Dunaliella salina]|uniref:BBSome complex member BBS5 PH domain-containing protein n=1 Tax=Dunaliella salina TaxID=3046 RepID=A0ABQ7G501_DUNSA|nr:hypothetical protein DUNSADRAFT_15656 [Dunaliella salina]|eukprot:KAF5829681.1 hypothetical protein DUNSADRAFT_15656 [Dunaliella salina]